MKTSRSFAWVITCLVQLLLGVIGLLLIVIIDPTDVSLIIYLSITSFAIVMVGSVFSGHKQDARQTALIVIASSFMLLLIEVEIMPKIAINGITNWQSVHNLGIIMSTMGLLICSSFVMMVPSPNPRPELIWSKIGFILTKAGSLSLVLGIMTGIVAINASIENANYQLICGGGEHVIISAIFALVSMIEIGLLICAYYTPEKQNHGNQHA